MLLNGVVVPHPNFCPLKGNQWALRLDVVSLLRFLLPLSGFLFWFGFLPRLALAVFLPRTSLLLREAPQEHLWDVPFAFRTQKNGPLLSAREPTPAPQLDRDTRLHLAMVAPGDFDHRSA